MSFDYLNWCEEHLHDKWSNHLPEMTFVLKNIKAQKSLFDPGATANSKNYMEFLHGLKNIDRVVLLKCRIINDNVLLNF